MCINSKARYLKIGASVMLGIAVLGWVAMALWNWLLPNLFVGVHEIGYMQAMGVLLLSKILFGGLRGHGGHAHWRYHRWEQMTLEDREKFKSGMRGCCGGKHEH